MDVRVQYASQDKVLSLLVIEGSGPTLLGQDWLQHIRLDWHSLNHVDIDGQTSLKGILQRHTEVFSEELGHLKGFTTKIHVDPDAVPQFCKARPVPYALRKRVEQELSRLEAAGVIEQVEFSDLAAPIVPFTKQDRSVRICGDYQLTVNRVAKLDTYPLPRIEDLFHQTRPDTCLPTNFLG